MKRIITEKELKYITYEYKNACNLGKMYLLPKIHNRLSNVLGRPVSSNCQMPFEKVSEVLDYHLKPCKIVNRVLEILGTFLKRFKILIIFRKVDL